MYATLSVALRVPLHDASVSARTNKSQNLKGFPEFAIYLPFFTHGKVPQGALGAALRGALGQCRILVVGSLLRQLIKEVKCRTVVVGDWCSECGHYKQSKA